MTGSIALDVVIGLVFIYTLYSLLTTTLVEFFATLTQLRARNLVKGIERMLDDDQQPLLSKMFYDTPLIKYMGKGSWFSIKKPSYIHARNFSKAIVHILKSKESRGETTYGMIKESVETLKVPNSDKLFKETETGKLLVEFLNESENNLEKFKELLEDWFNDTMDRVGGWYKRKITIITLIIGLIVATLFNIDTFKIAENLAKDPKIREQFVQMAGELSRDSSLIVSAYNKDLAKSLKTDSVLLKRFKGDVKAFNNFIDDSVGKEVAKGQKILMNRMDSLYTYTKKSEDILTSSRIKGKGFIFDSWMNFWGCLVTAIALSLGAPFWFDLLSKLMKIRGSISQPATPNTKENKKS